MVQTIGSNRVKEYEGYVDYNYRPDKDDLVCEYFIEPAKGISLEEAAQRVASESSIGTWTDIGTLSQELFDELSPKIFFIDKKRGVVRIAYSKELFEGSNIPQILSAVAGNVFGMIDVKKIKLMDIDFPESFTKSYRGPYYGVEGVRRLMGVRHRPFVGTIVKPKIGLSEANHASVAYQAWVGGCDYVKDDRT